MRHPVNRPETCSVGVPDGQEFGLIVLNFGSHTWNLDLYCKHHNLGVFALIWLYAFESAERDFTAYLNNWEMVHALNQ